MIKRCMGCMETYNDDTNICPHCGYIMGTGMEEAIHLPPGTLFHDRYIIGKVLGYGGFGVTYLAWDGKLEQKVAIKEYLPSEFSTRIPGQSTVSVFSGEKTEQFQAGMHKFIDEARKLAQFQNQDGIVKVFDSFEENGTAYIIMEHLDGITLKQYLKQKGTIAPEVAVEMLLPMMESLQTVHAVDLLHRDIAPDNIMITKEGQCKLIDFGASRFATTTHSRSLTVIVKPGYSPEEQYRSRGDQGPYTDVYSLAATIYNMVTGKTPPDAMVRRAKYENENKDILVAPHKFCKGLPVNIEIALLNALNVRIEDRTPNIAKFVEELQADPPAKRVYGKIKKLDFYTWPMWLKVASSTFAALLVLFGVLLATGVIKFKNMYTTDIVLPPGVVAVPNVEGEINTDAIRTLEEGKLVAVAQGSVISEYVEAGKIVFQNPAGGSYANENDSVYLTVSCGSGEVIAAVGDIATVPFVIWDTIDDATMKLDMAGLGEPIIIERYDDNVEAGLVISQSVDPGTQVTVGTRIELVVSKGPEPFALPNVVGMTEDDAREVISAVSLRVTVQYEYDPSVPEGTVIRQDPANGSMVVRGELVTLTVCSNSADSLVEVPDVVGLAQDEGRSQLEIAGFIVTILENNSDDVEAGYIISQTPAGNATVQGGANVTIYVSKGPSLATVTFNANGGTCSEDSRVVTIGEGIGDLPIPTRTDYTFTGWYTGETGGVQANAATQVRSTSGLVLYAHWTKDPPRQWTLTFDANASDASLSQTSMTVTYTMTYGTLPTPTREGYDFSGWYTEPMSGTKITETSNVTIDANHTVYAHWTEKTYTVTFNATGGTADSASKNVIYNSVFGTLPNASRTGYTFDGWFTDEICGDLITSSDIYSLKQDTTLYAQWTPNVYTVYFDGNSGTPDFGSAGYTYDCGYNSEFSSLPSASRTGYTFAGWYTSPDGGTQITGSTTVTITESMTLYAHWSVNSYTVLFDSNGGSECSAISVNYDSTYGTLPSPTRTGYDFNGWSLSGSTISASSTVSTASDHTLVASWSPRSYTITFNANGGSCSTTSKGVTYGSSVGSLPTATQTYYTFAGWYTSASGGTRWYDGDTYYNDGNLTLYAHWTQNGFGSWTNWSTTNPGAGNANREVESRQVAASYNVYHYYWATTQRCNSDTADNSGSASVHYRELTVSVSSWNSATAVASHAWHTCGSSDPYGMANRRIYNNSAAEARVFVYDGMHLPFYIGTTNYQTEYRYRDRIQ